MGVLDEINSNQYEPTYGKVWRSYALVLADLPSRETEPVGVRPS
jgi:hypothetical protein